MKLNFAEPFEFLLHPYRYKIALGGRASGKSWHFALGIISRCVSEKTRVLCTREIQKSIKDSVHKLLSDQINALGVASLFKILETEIRGVNGSEITFSGLQSHTVESIKSYEGVDVVWCEEAHLITKKSWDVLLPTIRKAGSEIWITFNPDLETDETYRRFVLNPPADAFVRKVNYIDNPFFNDIMESERLRCKETQPDDYPNIWLGECRPAVEGAIYFNEIKRVEEEGRICLLPHDPALLTHVVFDLGFNDAMAIGLVQKHLSRIGIIGYIEDNGRTIADYSAQLKQLPYAWGKLWLPHDGFAGDYKTGMSTYSILKRMGWNVAEKEEIIQLPVEEGIKVTRIKFPQMYFAKGNTDQLIERLKRYRRRVSRETETAGSPLHDDNSHAADMLRYVAVNSDNMRNEQERLFIPLNNITYAPLDPGVGI